jgi:hypothetical protein
VRANFGWARSRLNTCTSVAAPASERLALPEAGALLFKKVPNFFARQISNEMHENQVLRQYSPSKIKARSNEAGPERPWFHNDTQGFRNPRPMSAFLRVADSSRTSRDVRFVPRADLRLPNGDVRFAPHRQKRRCAFW